MCCFLRRDYIIIAGPGLCQAFSDYQMQQMTSNFIEQFGFNDEEFADQDDVVEWVLILHDPFLSHGILTGGCNGAAGLCWDNQGYNLEKYSDLWGI